MLYYILVPLFFDIFKFCLLICWVLPAPIPGSRENSAITSNNKNRNRCVNLNQTQLVAPTKVLQVFTHTNVKIVAIYGNTVTSVGV